MATLQHRHSIELISILATEDSVEEIMTLEQHMRGLEVEAMAWG